MDKLELVYSLKLRQRGRLHKYSWGQGPVL